MSMTQPIVRGRNRLLSTNSTQTAFVLAAGHYANFSTATVGIIPMGQARGVRILFFGTGSDTTTFDYRIWSIFQNTNEIGNIPSANTDFELAAFGYGTATIATAATGVSGSSIVSSSEFFADTLTFTLCTTATTPAGPGTVAVEAFALGEPSVYSPANGEPACLYIPNFDGNSLGIEFDRTGATACNAVWQTIV